MAQRWFRLPETGDGTADNHYRPDFFGHPVNGYSGTVAHPEGAPKWVVRVTADQATLDDLAAEPGVVALDTVPTAALETITGQSRDAADWNRGFNAGET